MQQQLTKDLQPKKSERNWVTILLIIVAVSIVISIIVNLTTTQTPVQQNTWNSTTPGYKITNQAKKLLGEPIEVTKNEFGTENSYRSSYPSLHNTITVAEDDTVKLIVEYIVYDPNHTLAQYIDQFGQPDLKLRNHNYTEYSIANVFLNAGLVVFTHEFAETVEIKWYFEPTSAEEFLQTYGKDLEDLSEEHGPESFQ